MIKKKSQMNPIMSYIILICVTILISGFLSFINLQSEYNLVNPSSKELINNVVEVKNLFSLSGLKHIVITAVNDFVNFPPLGALLIVFVGIGVLESSGFLKTAFTLLTKHINKNALTFGLIIISLMFSLVGDIGYIIMLPLGALLFKYGKRNPLGGVIASFAALSFGYGINILLSSNDSSLLSLTLDAARIISPKYSISVFFALFYMAVALIMTAYVFTNITEKKIMPKLGKYEEEFEEVILVKKDYRALFVSLVGGFLYLLLIIYMIIPGLPLSGALLDHGFDRYIDMLFGERSLFAQSFVFIVTVWFLLIGILYGIVSKTFKSNKDLAESLSHSLDGIGSILVLMFFASLFINIYKESNLGLVFTSMISSLLGEITFNGLALIFSSFILIAIANILCPDSISKWAIISATMIPLFINASISPEFAQIVYNMSDSVTNGITPLLMYSVIYVAMLDKYNKSEQSITIFGAHKFMLDYSFGMFVVSIVLLLGWYLLGIPTGIGSFPGVIYGA